jgi:sulfinoalanine decarboxylase
VSSPTALRALVDEHLARELTEPVRAPRDPADIRATIDLSVGPARPFHQVVEEPRAVLALTPSTASPRFFNQLFGGRDSAAVLGDLLATVLNTSMYTYEDGGVHVLIELELARRMGALMGLPDAEGVFAPGGSLSNLTAMMLARDRARPDVGAPGAASPLRVYTSADSHYSIHKAAAILGIGRRNVVGVAVDARGRMRPEALQTAIQADLATGFVACMVNATAGTTVLGAFDPIPELADIAQRFGAWLHVDSAYGGSMVLHPECPCGSAVHRAQSRRSGHGEPRDRRRLPRGAARVPRSGGVEGRRRRLLHRRRRDGAGASARAVGGRSASGRTTSRGDAIGRCRTRG